MASHLLGRTNQAYPPVWLKLALPDDPAGIPALVAAAVEACTVIDVSSQPALWGQHLRHLDQALMACGGLDLEQASNEKHAAALIQAFLLQTLSAIGHQSIEFFFLNVRSMLGEQHISGALAALESAREEGCIKHLGLSADGPAEAVRSVWQFHDAFEVVLMPESGLSSLGPFAKERRVGTILRGGDRSEHTRLIMVSSAAQVRAAIRNGEAVVP